MGTPAIIIVEKDSKYRAIYNNYDGYPEHLFETLKEHYSDSDKANKLVELGDVSVVYPLVEPPEGQPHSWAQPYPGVTVAYARDRGETGVEFREYNSLEEAIRGESGCNYCYAFEDGRWYCP